jgi:hypothetical protein
LPDQPKVRTSSLNSAHEDAASWVVSTSTRVRARCIAIADGEVVGGPEPGGGHGVGPVGRDRPGRRVVEELVRLRQQRGAETADACGAQDAAGLVIVPG